jgi:hypothetical protein
MIGTDPWRSTTLPMALSPSAGSTHPIRSTPGMSRTRQAGRGHASGAHRGKDERLNLSADRTERVINQWGGCSSSNSTSHQHTKHIDRQQRPTERGRQSATCERSWYSAPGGLSATGASGAVYSNTTAREVKRGLELGLDATIDCPYHEQRGHRQRKNTHVARSGYVG